MSKAEEIKSIYKEMGNLVERLGEINCTEDDCGDCPFRAVETTDSDRPLDCGGIIDLFKYNKED